MKVISFNSFSAIKMYDRLSRRQTIPRVVSRWVNKYDPDVILLQEFNSWTYGPITLLLSFLTPIISIFPILIAILDVLMILEGLILPWFVYDNKTFIISELERMGFQVIKTRDPEKYCDGGLIIASRHPMDLSSQKEIVMKTNRLHWSTILGVNIKYNNETVRIYNCHLIPSLPDDIGWFYWLCNCINVYFGDDIDLLRDGQIKRMAEEIKNYDLPAIIGGDFNITYDSADYKKILSTSNLKDLRPADVTFTKSGSDEPDKKKCITDSELMTEIDYIMINFKPAMAYKKVLSDTVSDHFPILAMID
jgi:hypothetical protein